MKYYEKYDTKNFNRMYQYSKEDLGANYSNSSTVFKLWAPTANSVEVLIYKTGDKEDLIKKIPLKLGKKGVWETEVKGDLNLKYYIYEVVVEGKTNFVVDPYTKALGVNGKRGMIIDLHKTNPIGWNSYSKPDFIFPTDAIIYELHVRDFSIDENSGIKNKGRYLAFTEKNTMTDNEYETGIDHLVDLGITHVHLLPVFDYAQVDEMQKDTEQYNWGYDPQNYNVPDGSYATNPFNGEVRIKEFKKMIKSLHDSGIRVVMDVVYNHTFDSENSHFHKIIPFYFHRHNEEEFIDGSGSGNEIDSCRPMVRKYIVDSVKYWAKEFHIDGFRFDMMSLHDVETMNAVRKALNEIDPTIIIYGEGWTTDPESGKETENIKEKISKVQGVAVFNDDMRDGLKGKVDDDESVGFVNGDFTLEESIKFSIAGACKHSQINLKKVQYANSFWAINPTQTVNYVSTHEYHTLWDKLQLSTPDVSVEDRIKMHKLAIAIVLTSQGIPLMHAGCEFLRSKGLSRNSYNLGDDINKIDWTLKEKNYDVYEYVRGLIELRKEHPAFRLLNESEVNEKLHFWDTGFEGVIAFDIDKRANRDKWENISVIFNVSHREVKIDLPHNAIWNIVVDGQKAGVETIKSFVGQSVYVEPLSTIVLYSNNVDRSDLDDSITRRRTSVISVALGLTGFLVMHKAKSSKRRKQRANQGETR